VGIPSKLLIGAALLFIVIIAVVCGIYLARPAYNYCRRSPASIIWNGVEFKLPPPWFRLGNKEQVAGAVTFFRDQFPWAEREFSSITFKPPFPNDFGQNPEEGLRRWEQLNKEIWFVPNPYPKVINYYYSKARSAKNEFRCANTVLQMQRGEKVMDIDCIETDSGWRFDYEGTQDYASEAMSILQTGM